MSFIGAATAIGFTGAGATIAAGAMMGGTMTIGMNVVQGRDPFDNLGQGMLMGGLTAGISPFVGEALGVSAGMASGITAGALGYAATGDIGKGLTAGLSAYGLAEMSGNLELAGGKELADAQTAANANIAAAETSANASRIAGNVNSQANRLEFDAVRAYEPVAIETTTGIAGRPISTDYMDISSVDNANAAANANISTNLSANPNVSTNANVNAEQLNTATFDSDVASSATPRVSVEEYKRMLIDKGMSPEEIRAEFANKGKEVVGSDLKSAGKFLKANAKNLMYASAPIFADTENNMPETVTKPGMIRPYSFDPYSGRYVAGTPYEAKPVKVAEGGLMGMDDGGYSPGMLDFVQRSEPVARMASGGIAALAAGGTSYKNLTKDSSEDEIAAAYKQFTAGAGGNTQENQAAAIDYLGKLGIGEDRIGGAYTKFQASPTYTDYTQQDVVNFLKSNKNADIAAETAKFNANPLLVNQTISGLTAGYTDPTQTTGGSGSRQYYDALLSAGIDADELFSANQALTPNYSFADDKTAGGLRRAFDVASDFRGFDPAGDTQLLKDIEWVKKMDIDGANTVDIARLTGLSINEVATREAAARAALAATGGGGGGGGVGGGGDGVGGGGKTVVNPDGSVTTTPDIPGRPEGGFKGMKDVRDAYTAGGGSLGYIPYAPKTIEEFNTKYADRLTGGSKQSYDYLTGKTPYSPTPYTPTGEVMKPYAESVLGIPTPSANKQYLFDPKTRQYKINPDYAIPTRDSEGKVSYDLTNNDVVEFFSTSPTDDAFFSWMTTNNLSAEQIASATGMPISEVYKRIKKGKPAKDASTETTEDGTGLSVPDIVGANGGLMAMAGGGMAGQYDLGGYSDGGRLLRGPGDGVSDSIPATIGNKRPARLADGEFVVPARIVSELGNGSTEAGARKLYAMMERVQAARRGTVGKRKVAKNSRADKYLPA